MTYKTKQSFQTNLNIPSKFLNKDIDNLILIKLKEKYENKCSENGFIIEDSIEINKRNMGKIVTISNKSYISYDIMYNADIIYPTEGDDFEIIVDRINKMGVLGYIKINDNDFEGSPLIIIIPTEYFNSSTRDINSITKNQKLMIKVLGCRIKFNSKKIQIVAKPVS